MTAIEAQLFQLLKDRCFQRGTFRLASGAMSDYYIDGRMAEVFSQSAHLIGEVIYERTKDLPIEAIGGLAIGAVPLTTATVISYHLHGRTMEGFWVRDKAKTHGTQKVIEGNLKPGSRVAILDDVITTGSSSLKALQEVKEIGCEAVLVLALVDRLQGAAKAFQNEGITRYEAIYTIRDFGVEVASAVRTPPQG
jgi:orotate phosphoribosyltransferase